ncbi:hypothetical protein I0Q91_04360 [Halanaerobiaceae bacterium Z-7014]|uniref:Uncharacterized protein n=1 Tax=Halonatronomonas betaini TaxID=2778430 RepID=A0A931F896_9FIRM|nr:hypothetical protein [Halonatronomonas betaini]MBF8436303.1 hypothetical protein [Halonatronomonas betaini]
MSKDGYKKYWRIGLIVFVVGLLMFSVSVFAVDFSVELQNRDFTSGQFGAPDPSALWLTSEYNFPEDCDLMGVKINDPITGSFNDQTGEIEFGYGATDFNVELTVDGGYLDFEVSGYTVYYVWVKAGRGGILYGYPNGTTEEFGLISPQDSISHVTFYFCEPEEVEELTVTKTVETYFEREHFWDIAKEVTTDKELTKEYEGEDYPKIWLIQNDDSGNETAYWTIDVTYQDYEDSGFNVSGTVTIINTGDVDAVITEVKDVLGDTEIDIVVDFEVSFPHTLLVGETLTGTYSEDVDSKIAGYNKITVTTERDSYFADEPIDWGEDPDEEINATVNIEDISELFEPMSFGPVAAPNDGQFTYNKDFDWNDYDFEELHFVYDNTATIIETDQSATAKLLVNLLKEELTVSKDVVTYFEREHFWDIEKIVETEFEEFINGTPKIWLYADGSGNEEATWTVDVTYEGYEDSDFNVSGTITIENTGDLDAVITSVVDVLAGDEIDIVFDPEVIFPYTLAFGEILTGTYSVDEFIEGDNLVTVTTERDSYVATEEIVWGEPAEEFFETVNIEDFSDLFGKVGLGTVTAPNGDSFNYNEYFDFADYEPGSYTFENTASILETGQYAEAILKVNVQDFIYESAWAKGDPAEAFTDNGFSNWGWTNPIEPGTYEMDLWAGAAQSDTSKGTLVGSVTVVYDEDGYVDVKFNVDSPYSLEETHVYAGSDMFPQQRRGRNTVDTVAPGQYYNDGPFDGSKVYVIAHAVVGMPDPDFGPLE